MPVSLRPIADIENPIVPTICLYEVFKRILQGFGEERALDVMGILSLGTTVGLDQQIAIHAAQISNELNFSKSQIEVIGE